MKFIQTLFRNFKNFYFKKKQRNRIISYINFDQKPWSIGYSDFRDQFIEQTIQQNLAFFSLKQLPLKFGKFLDERVVEYPWFLKNASNLNGKLLDAGSALNYEFLLNNTVFKNLDVTIATLEPEAGCFWRKRISYSFSDIRQLPFKDEWFDNVVSISTIEHIGMDNSIYSSNQIYKESQCNSFLDAVLELKRVLKKGGKLFITVPYGVYENHGWYQQFNAEMIKTLISEFAPVSSSQTYFKYENDGWQFSNQDQCDEAHGFDIHATKYFDKNSTKDYDDDYAACSRAIAALIMEK